AGWDMPVQYTSIIDEHVAVRTAAGLFDVSHMGRLSFAGREISALIQRVFTNDPAGMAVGQARYGFLCNEDGGVRDDVIVYRWDDTWTIVVNAGNRLKIVEWLNDSKGTLHAQTLDQTRDTCMFAVQGPKAVALCAGLFEADVSSLRPFRAAATRYHGQNCAVSRTGYTGEDGLEIMINAKRGVQLWDELIQRGAKPCGLGARDTLRLEAALPLYGHELTEDIDPFQAGLGWAVKLDKGDFRGREALLRRKDDPTRRRRVGLELAGKRIARDGAAVKLGGEVCGVVTSGTFAPTLQKPIAMAYLDPAALAPGTNCFVDIRGKDEPATVVALPFYQRPR
ncbi:MAG: glycine cleavage system aminomethyltransferase GcvT, partial [Gemmataceae bacterium]|nr:glycine cleavage system aminomethyltransferase GcvT [Gemmataceae bacterium]